MIYISENANEKIIEYLKTKDRVSIVHSTGITDERISSHPDIYMCSICGEIISARSGEIGSRYPLDCAFNACQAGGYLIANTKCLNGRLKEKALSCGLKIVHVSQGYTKCNILPVDEHSIITSDRGIYAKTKDLLDVLLISAGNISLKGFPYGFIGGTGGRIGDEIVFNGSPALHPDGEKMINFIEERGLKAVTFDYPLEDIGSIIS